MAASIVAAWAIVHYGVVQSVLEQTGASVLLSSLLAGLFFTSMATTPVAIAVLAELALTGNPLLVALVGGAGAVAGDYFIFAFVRDRVGEDIGYLLKRTGTPRFFKLFHRRTFKRLLPFLGGLIIASPLPDELGLALLGAAHMSTKRFLLISYCFNAGGIFLIGLAARSLAGA